MLDVVDLSYTTSERPILQSINACFEKGCLYALLGANGAGKTTLLKTINGILTPTKGHVLWQKAPLLSKEREEISRTITLIPQAPQLSFDLTAHEMVQLGTYSHQKPPKPHFADYALKATNGWHLKNRMLSTLSQGEKGRIYIARAIAVDAPVLLCDEPTANLDIQHQRDIWKLLKDISNHGKIVIVATHDLEAASLWSDHAILLDHGRIKDKRDAYHIAKAMREALLDIPNNTHRL